MERWLLLGVSVWFGASLASSAAWADTVWMGNGDRLSGSVTGITNGELVMETDYAGRVVIDLGAVARMETEERLNVRLASGRVVSGRFDVDETDAQILETGNGVESIDLVEVRRLAEDHIEPVDLGHNWRTNVDMTGAVTSGNSNTESVRARARSTLRRTSSEHRFSLLARYEQSDGSSTRNQGQFSYDYRWFFQDDWYLLGNTEYFQDRIRDIDRRVSVSSGVGHRFWEDSLGELAMEISTGLTHEGLPEDKTSRPAVRWAMNFNRHLWGKRIEVFQENRVLKILQQDRGEIVSSSAGIRYALNRRWNLNFTVDLEHETRPIEDKENTDLSYALGVGLRF